jgi:ABC-type nickel/cobalt efflux system permease component RcnA
MKLMTLVTVLMLALNAFAHNHEETKKKVGHDKEHQHVTKDAMDHEHDDYHHGKHDHKSHHPEHVDKPAKKDKKKKSKK